MNSRTRKGIENKMNFETKSNIPGNAFRKPDGAPINANERNAMSLRTQYSETAIWNNSSCGVVLKVSLKLYANTGGVGTYRSPELLYLLHEDGTVTNIWNRRCGEILQ